MACLPELPGLCLLCQIGLFLKDVDRKIDNRGLVFFWPFLPYLADVWADWLQKHEDWIYSTGVVTINCQSGISKVATPAIAYKESNYHSILGFDQNGKRDSPSSLNNFIPLVIQIWQRRAEDMPHLDFYEWKSREWYLKKMTCGISGFVTVPHPSDLRGWQRL